MQDNVKKYYGEVLQSSGDLQTDACCTFDDMPAYLKPILANIHDEVASRYYGCGLIAPLGLEGCAVLDLGCGAGQDVYALAQLVGPNGAVVGVDMTEEQLAVARRHQDWHAEKFGFDVVRFVDGDIERLDDLGLGEAQFDIIVSNCVINLVEDKGAVFRAAHKLLKPGGEFFFSDVYADRRLPDALRHDPVAQGECLGGALYWNDFLNEAKAAGFADPRLMTSRRLDIRNDDLRARLKPAVFHSATYRLFKIDGLEPACEDYGQAVRYRGGLAQSENAFVLDGHHHMERGRMFPVCGNTYRMLKDSRFSPYFDYFGDGETHFGIFPGCGTVSPFNAEDAGAAAPEACC
ncbi:MAG: methyltransferase domain-containing protein [Pseudomonadota bacterium]